MPCPVCHSDDYFPGPMVDRREDVKKQIFHCQDCGTFWVDTWVKLLSEIRGVETPITAKKEVGGG